MNQALSPWYLRRSSVSTEDSIVQHVASQRQGKKLEYFNNELEVPGGYGILSHRWGNDWEEISFSEIEEEGIEQKRSLGYRKIDRACQWARNDGLKYVWVDTCESGSS